MAKLRDKFKVRNTDKDTIKTSWTVARTLITSMIFIKTLFLYFGLKYSEYPGEGYGYGLAITAVLSVSNMLYFLYKMKDVNFD